MIKRFLTRCLLCEHNNTLRVTLGINTHQNHSFECQGCGEVGEINLTLDFNDRERFDIPGFGRVTFPRVVGADLKNAEWSEVEGSITNLDPTFLVQEDDLHKDRIFPWMRAASSVIKPAMLESAQPGKLQIGDILDQAGLTRGIREGISATLKAYELHERGRKDLAEIKLKELERISGAVVADLPNALAMICAAILGRQSKDDVEKINGLARLALQKNPGEFQRMRSRLLSDIAPDFLERQLGVLKDYRKGYDQFGQAWFYAAEKQSLSDKLHPSTRDLNSVKYFYGTAFEHLSSGLVLPALLNNILNGRPFDQFEHIELKTYLSLDKSRRAQCIQNVADFGPLWDEFNSTLRNGSHHQGLRLKPDSRYIIQYRTGDSKTWNDISYSEYLVKCNRIQICLMKLLSLQFFVFGVSAFSPKAVV